MTPWEGCARPPRRWQAEALPLVRSALAAGDAGVVSAVTGAGKSILIAELCRLALARSPDLGVLVTTPTRALVRQLSATIEARVGAGKVGRFYTGSKDTTQPVIVTCNPSSVALAGEFLAAGRKVGLTIVDECHGSEAETLRTSIPILKPRWRVGFTATPFRSLPKESLSLWSKVIYRYTLDDALRDGVLVPFEAKSWDGQGTSAVDEVCLSMIKAHAQGPGIVSALSIEDAEVYAGWLSERGVSARAIHSRMTASAQGEALADLEAGRLAALVHVSLLAEGVDLPWLRWLCMRRPVQARVRFVQELGRVLRVHPGKTSALVLDPHDLLGLHGIAHPEMLGEALEAEAEEGKEGEGVAGERMRVMPPAVAVDSFARWARGLVIAFQAAGLVPPLAAQGWAWRSQPASERQTSALVRMKWATRHVPEPHKKPMKMALDHVRLLGRGGASDLLAVLGAVADLTNKGGEWPALDVPVPPKAAFKGLS